MRVVIEVLDDRPLPEVGVTHFIGASAPGINELWMDTNDTLWFLWVIWVFLPFGLHLSMHENAHVKFVDVSFFHKEI